MSRQLEDAFQACLQAIEGGQDLESALASFPGLQAQLRPLLAVAMDAIDASEATVPPEAAARSRTRALSLAAALRDKPAPRTPWPLLARGLTAALAALALVLVSGFGLLLASAQSLPGEGLYPVKRAAEAARIRFTANDQDRISLSISYDHRRVDEVRQLLIRGRQVQVEYEGILTDQNGSLWTVEGIPALQTSDSYIQPGLKIGDFVGVQGHSTDQGWVRADSIEAAGYLVLGTVDTIGKASWTVAGEALTVVGASQIDAGIEVGDLVEATVHRIDDESIAIRIRSVGAVVTPTPLPSPTIHPTEAPGPTAVPSDDEEQEEEGASPTPQPTSTDEHEGEGEDDHESSEATPTPGGQEIEFSGVVEAINGNVWTIGGRAVTVNEDTRYEDGPKVGDEVDVRAIQQADGSLLAERIKAED